MQQTLMSPTLNIYISPSQNTHTHLHESLFHTQISELIASSSWAYPHTYTEIMVLDALMLSAHEYALDSDVQHVRRITSDKHSLPLLHSSAYTERVTTPLTHTLTHIYMGLYTSCRSFSAHDPGTAGVRARHKQLGCEAVSSSFIFFTVVFFSREC